MDERSNRGSLVLGAIFILAGLLFLASRLAGFSGWQSLWPFVVILFGCAFFVGMALGGRQTAGLAIPGSIIIVVGLILLIQDRLQIYETWAYAWTLIISAVGLGLVIAGGWGGSPEMTSRGWRLFRLGLLLFVIFGAFFEMVFGFTGVAQRARQLLWPLILIAVGAILFITRAVRLFTAHEEQRWDERDLFWPVLIAGFGVIWLLLNLGWLPFDSLSALFGLWPLLLVAAGMDLIAGRKHPWVGAALAALLIGGVLWFSFNANQFPFENRFSLNLNLGSGAAVRETGSGKIVEQSFDEQGYHAVDLSAGGVATLLADNQEGLTVQADDNLLPYLVIEVRGGVLQIKVKPGYSLAPSQPIHYTIHVKSLNSISVSGSGEITMSGFSGDNLSIETSGLGKVSVKVIAKTLNVAISGSGSIDVAGTAEQLKLDISGAGKFNAPDLQVQQAALQISGVGHAVLWVVQSLDVQASGVGEVAYYGSPTVSQQTSGSVTIKGLGAK